MINALLHKTVSALGGRLLSNATYNLLIHQRSIALSELSDIEGVGLVPGVTGVVFSKNRAMQLFALLNSFSYNVRLPCRICVIYCVDSESHLKAYQDVIDIANTQFPWAVFIRQNGRFHDILLNVLRDIKTRNMFFLVDDDIFIDSFNLDDAINLNAKNAILSFRHGPSICRSYTANAKYSPPAFIENEGAPELLIFEWFERKFEWSDPWSVDGQVYSTAEVRVISRQAHYNAPNSYETALKAYNNVILFEGRKGFCYKMPKLINIPINRVQCEVNNTSGDISTNYLLEQWNRGLMLDISKIQGHVPSSTHEEHSISFIRR